LSNNFPSLLHDLLDDDTDDIKFFVVLVWMLQNFAEHTCRERRNIWYLNGEKIFEDSNDVDRIVGHVSDLLSLPQRRLTVLHNARGVVHGFITINIQVSSSRYRMDCSQSSSGITVPAIICHQIVEPWHVAIEHLDGLQLSQCTAVVSAHSLA
jgi:DNA topoisomerase VI subunit A